MANNLNEQARMDERFEKIENKLSLSEDLLEELNKTVYRQQLQIEQLQREIVSLREQVRASQPEEQHDVSREVPPHY